MSCLFRRGRRALLVSLVTSLTLLSGVASAAPNPAKPLKAPSGPQGPKSAQAQEPDQNDATPSTDVDCDKVKQPGYLKEKADAGEQSVICITLSKQKTRDTSGDNGNGNGGGSGGVAPFATTPNPQGICQGRSTNTWWYNRGQFCIIAYGAQVDTVDTRTGAWLGTTHWNITHAAGLDARSTQWNMYSDWTLVDQSGPQPATIIDSAWNRCGGCTGTSQSNPVAGPIQAGLNQTIRGNNYLSDSRPWNTVNGNIDVWWTTYFRCLTCNVLGWLTYSFPLKVRCDLQDGVNGTTPGCVVPSYIPEVQFTGYWSGNQSTALGFWMQSYNVDHWGSRQYNNPLTRMADPTQARINHDSACYGFQYNYPGTEQCDEYPMARTYQSPAMIGLWGPSCSDLWPVFSNGSWTFYDTGALIGQPYSQSQRCGRGHVAQTYNGSNGGVYGAAVQNYRIIASDPFWTGFYA